MEEFSPLMPRDRDREALMRRCKPLKVGMTLLILMAFAVTLSLSASPMESSMRMTVLGTMFVSMWLTFVMLVSLCEQNSQTAAWVAVVLSPVVIGLFSLQLETILAGLFGMGVSNQVMANNAINA